MSKIFFQGAFGAYSHLAALSIEPKAEIIPCKTFDECFIKASKDSNSKIIIPESNRITGNIGIEYLVFEYRLNIYAEYYQRIEHNLLALPGTKISEIRDDDREYYLWFKEDELLTTYKIFNDFGTRKATWRLKESKLSGE